MFNALKYTQELERAGFSREQAEASVRLLIDVMNETFSTKSDLREFELRVDSRFKDLEAKVDARYRDSEARVDARFKDLDIKLDSTASRFDSRIQELEYKLTIKLGTMMTFAVGLTATLIKLL